MALFYNNLPVSTLYQQWMDDDFVPDEWTWHAPFAMPWGDGSTKPAIDIVNRPIPDDLYQRYVNLVCWCVQESCWDQVFRRPQVSHREYQHVIDYLRILGRDMGYEVPPPYSEMDFPMPLDECEWAGIWHRYPKDMIDSFLAVGYILNPTDPVDDERHPWYDRMEYLRIWKKREALKKINPRTGRPRGEPAPLTIATNREHETPAQSITVTSSEDGIIIEEVRSL